MKLLTVKFTLLLLLLLWFDRCESLTDISLPPIFFPFGTDQGDSVVTVGYRGTLKLQDWTLQDWTMTDWTVMDECVGR